MTIKRGEAMSRTVLFHELGHYYHRHVRSSREEAEAYDAKRMQMVSEGKVIQNEKECIMKTKGSEKKCKERKC